MHTLPTGFHLDARRRASRRQPLYRPKWRAVVPLAMPRLFPPPYDHPHPQAKHHRKLGCAPGPGVGWDGFARMGEMHAGRAGGAGQGRANGRPSWDRNARSGASRRGAGTALDDWETPRRRWRCGGSLGGLPFVRTCAERAPERACARTGALRFARDCAGGPPRCSRASESVPPGVPPPPATCSPSGVGPGSAPATPCTRACHHPLGRQKQTRYAACAQRRQLTTDGRAHVSYSRAPGAYAPIRARRRSC